jgi:hypothetical protein
LEASVDGNSWTPMVAKSSNDTFLSREGLETSGGNINLGYNSQPFSNTTYSIYKPFVTYYPPDDVTIKSVSALKQYSRTTGCKVELRRLAANTWQKDLNKKEDFSVNLFLSISSSWTPGTKLNCVVTNYNSISGELTFDATPGVSGTCKFCIIVRSGDGTGLISNTIISTSFMVEAPLLQFSLPSMTVQADSQAARSLARCAYVAGAYTGSPGVVYPFYPEGSNTPLYLYFGKVDNGGQRWMFQGQKTGSPFVTQGIMPESGAQITISGTPQNVRYDTYTGVVLTKLFEGDFSVTIVTDGNYLIPSMAWREAVFNPVETFSYRGTSGSQNVWWVTFNAPYGWTGSLSPALTTTGLYWNSASGQNASWTTMYLRYQRIGNSLTVNWGSAVDAINTQLLSATCTAGHLVGCSIASGGDGSFVDIVGYTGTLYEYVAPSSLSSLTFSGTLQAKLPLIGCTVTLGGTSFVAKRINLWNVKVHLFDSEADATAAGTTKPAILNCIVKSYTSTSGVVTFTAAPQTSGNDMILVVFVDAPDGTTVAIANVTTVSVVAYPYVVELLLDAASYTGIGTTWFDLSGNGNNGTLNGHAYSSLGGGSLTFTTSQVVTGNISASIFSSGASVSVWFYRTSINSWSGLFSNCSLTTNGGCALLSFWNMNTGGSGVTGAILQVNGPSNVLLDIGTHLNRWIYATVVFNGVSTGSAVKISVYNNGTLLSSSTNLASTLSTTTNYWIGQQISGNSSFFNGNIAQVIVYKKALSDVEIAANYNATKSRFGL